MKEFASSQLGNELQQQSALQGGVQEMLVASTTSLTGIVKEFGLFDFPFLFSNAKQADAMVDGPLGKMLSAKLAEKGVVVLGFFDLGFRNVTNSKRPDHQGRRPGRPEAARDPEPGVPGNLQDLQGEPDADAVRRAVRRARKQGRGRPGEPVRGDPVEQVLRGEEVRQRHQPRVRDQPGPDQQALLGQAVAGGAEAAAGRRHRSPELPARGQPRGLRQGLAELKAKGMVYNDIAPAELARMRAEVKPVYDKFAASYDPAVVNLFKSELERVSKL